MFNKVILVGNLTRDPELRFLPSGSAICNTGLAVNRRFKKQDGSQAEEVCFVDISFFGRTAEIANQYLKKGSQILVEGRLKFDQWNDQSGAKRSKHSVIVESMQMLGSKNDNAHHNQDYSHEGGNYSSSYSQNNQQKGNYQNFNKKAPVQQEEFPEIDVDQDNLDVYDNEQIPF